MMDTTIIYNDYLSGDAKALERLMEIYGDKLTLYINGYIKNRRQIQQAKTVIRK